MPEKYILRYNAACPIISSGVAISTRDSLAHNIPIILMAIPLIKASNIAVCTVSDISFVFPEA